MEEVQEFKVARIHKLENAGKVLAFVDLNINEDFIIKGLRVVDGQNGKFVTMPQTQGKDGKWYNTVLCLSEPAKQLVTKCVLEAYENSQ